MRIVITGNMGYVGPVVTDHLRQTWPGAELIGIDVGWFASCLFGGATSSNSALNAQFYLDVRDVTPKMLEGAEAVVHLAAVSNDAMGKRFEAATDQINHHASLQVARAAAQAGVKNFVFASSCSVYGAAADGISRDEKSPLAPLTAYARSKVDTEIGLRALNSGMVITCLRFATACGMSPRLRLDLVLNDFVASAVVGGVVEVLSDGTPWRPLIHVRDMARAMEWAITRSANDGGRFLAVNAGSDAWNYQIRDLANAVGAAIPEAQVSISKTAPADNRSYKVDFALFCKLAPEHQPRESLASTVSELRDRMIEAGFADPDFRISSLARLVVLNQLVDSGALTAGLIPGELAA